MALSELTSNLSWYGTNAGFRAQQSVEQTRFNYDPGELTVAVAPRGFNNAGYQSNAFMARMSGNAFNINGQGTATRLTQLGEGTKFPIGPDGQTHEFDIKRTGFSLVARYSDTFSNKTLKGLAATYTTNSPIDDMYNKFKVRDEVYDPYGYAKTPYILKGIQKDGSSDPERWGTGTPGLNIPRGGITANAERTAADIERIGKFLIRPEGIAFIAKQNILRQMLPNIESSVTIPTIGGAVNKANPQRLYNPLNTIATVLGQSYGLRFRNFGVTPGDDGISRYEDVVTIKRGTEESRLLNNRLVTLRQERYNSSVSKDSQPEYWKSISTLSGGPDSIGGIGGTLFNKSLGSLTPVTQQYQYTWSHPYVSTYDHNNAEVLDVNNRTSNPNTKNEMYVKRAFFEIPYGAGQVSRLNKNSLAVLGSQRRSTYTITAEKSPTPPDVNTPADGYILTSLDSQLSVNNNVIPGYGDKSTIETRTSNYVYPYAGSSRTFNDDVITNTEFDTEEKEHNTRLIRNYAFTPDSEYQAEVNPSRKENRNPVIDFNKYRTISYNQIPERNGTRTNLDYAETTAANGVSLYSVSNTPIARKRAAIVQNTANVDVKDKYNSIVKTFKDTIIDDIWKGGSNKDLVKLKIGSVQFLAYITTLSMSDSFSTDQTKELLTAYTQISFSGHDRNISLGFMVVVDRPDRLKKQWTKLQTLQQYAGPRTVTEDNTIFPVVTTITIGDIYKNVPIVIESISYDIDNESPWEITSGNQRPMYIGVNVDCKVLPYSKSSLPGIS